MQYFKKTYNERTMSPNSRIFLQLFLQKLWDSNLTKIWKSKYRGNSNLLTIYWKSSETYQKYKQNGSGKCKKEPLSQLTANYAHLNWGSINSVDIGSNLPTRGLR